MLEELLAGGILLGALLGESYDWDDEVGKRFEAELSELLNTEEESLRSVISHPEENGRELILEMERLEKEVKGDIDRMKNELYDIYSKLQSISI